jgi:hypothetical protein
VSTSPLFAALIDDAALFPPANAAMQQAVDAHVGHRAAWYSALVGPFLCAASRLEELAAQLGARSDPFGVTVVVDTGASGVGSAVDAVASDDRMVLRGVEVPLRGDPLAENARRTVAALDAALGGPEDDEPAYVEIPRLPGWRDALEVVSDAGYRAKLRTGGVAAADFPPEDHVAAFILGCLDLGVPFKFTAGLHRAVRHTVSDGVSDGVEQHGFLNALLGVAVALDGGDAAEVAQTLADRDGAGVADRIRALPLRPAARVRTWCNSYGSCSIAEPVDDLLNLGLISKE